MDTEDRFARSRLFFYLIGALLVAAALSKSVLLLTNPFADLQVGLPKEIIWMSVVLDLALGILNFASSRMRLLSVINLSVFAFFGAFSLVRLILGATNCGCDGVLEIPIWASILINSLIVAYIVRNQHRRQEVMLGSRELVALVSRTNPIVSGIAAGSAFLILPVIGFPLLGLGSLVDRIFANNPIEAKVAFQKDLQVGKQELIEVAINNSSSWPAKFVGVQGSCSCLSIADDLTSRILPVNGHLSLPIWITPPKPGKLHQRLTILLDHPERFRMDVEVVGFVKRGE